MGDSRVTEILPVLEGAISEAFAACDTVEAAGALWAALSRAVSASAGEAVVRLGGDSDRVREALDRYFLQNPGL